MASMKGKRYISDNAQLMAEWDWEENIVSPFEITLGSNKKAFWKCDKGHKWVAIINSRNQGNGCPYCSNQKVLEGFNDLATVYPELATEWDYDRNENITPQMVVAGSGKKFWWKCKNGHSWDTTIRHRLTGSGCRFCANQKVLIGFNDLATTNPEIAEEWNYAKNADLLPTMFTIGSGRKVWWKCCNGHEWKSVIAYRVQRGCPICSNKQVLIGYNDLETTHPELAAEWHYEKNQLTPKMVTAGSNKVVWWKCRNGHEWQTQVNARLQGVGCAKCSAHLRTSFPEQALYYYIKKGYPDAINGYREIFQNKRTNMELDIYIPSISAAIEYDGIVWHNSGASREREIEKYHICKSNGILLIRVRESSDAFWEACDILIHSNYKGNYREFGSTIKELSKHISIPEDVDITRDRNEICAQYLPQFL